MMTCNLFIREFIAVILEGIFKFLAVDLCFWWVRIKPVVYHGIRIYGSPQFIISIKDIIDKINTGDSLLYAYICREINYVSEYIGKDDSILLRSRGLLVGQITFGYGYIAILRQLFNAAIKCRVYGGFHIWTSRMHADHARRVRQISLRTWEYLGLSGSEYQEKCKDKF